MNFGRIFGVMDKTRWSLFHVYTVKGNNPNMNVPFFFSNKQNVVNMVMDIILINESRFRLGKFKIDHYWKKYVYFFIFSVFLNRWPIWITILTPFSINVVQHTCLLIFLYIM